MSHFSITFTKSVYSMLYFRKAVFILLCLALSFKMKTSSAHSRHVAKCRNTDWQLCTDHILSCPERLQSYHSLFCTSTSKEAHYSGRFQKRGGDPTADYEQLIISQRDLTMHTRNRPCAHTHMHAHTQMYTYKTSTAHTL